MQTCRAFKNQWPEYTGSKNICLFADNKNTPRVLSGKRVSLLCSTNNIKGLLGMLPCQTANWALSVQHLMINYTANVALVK